MDKTIFKITILVLSFASFGFNVLAQEANIWKKYIGRINNEAIPLLFDYSYAGYNLGETGVPKKIKNFKIFNVLDFGAIPNDTISDQKAIQKAIHVAEKNNGGIVFFPKGEFLVNVNPKKANPILISSSNIILKGSGMGKNGTVIRMKHHMLKNHPDDPEYRVSYMFKFKPKAKSSKQTKIAVNANEGDFSIEVNNPTIFTKSKYIQLEMPYNTDAATASVANKTLRPHWERIKKKGVTFIEKHEIVRIEGNKIILKDPITNTIDTNYNWLAKTYNPLENVGVEDIFFRANFKEQFKHHKNYIHDNAWSIVAMQTVALSWVRRCRFANVTGAVAMGNCYASSILMLWVEGNSGHKLTNVTHSSRILTGLINDVSNNGQFHGASMSHKTSGSVIWRVKTPKRGWDSHADIPKNNLVDMYEAATMTAHGGFYKNEPHHLEGLTLWNYKRVGDPVSNYDFWKLSGKGMYWGFSVVNPTVVGLHGSKTTLNTSNIGYMESIGNKVFPESLYEAQLTHRLGKKPKWVIEALKEWKKIKNNIYKN